MSELELRIQHAIRTDAQRARDVERVGPFLATFTRETRNPYLNYAIPEPSAVPSPTEVEALARTFASRSLRPRLEEQMAELRERLL